MDIWLLPNLTLFLILKMNVHIFSTMNEVVKKVINSMWKLLEPRWHASPFYARSPYNSFSKSQKYFQLLNVCVFAFWCTTIHELNVVLCEVLLSKVATGSCCHQEVWRKNFLTTFIHVYMFKNPLYYVCFYRLNFYRTKKLMMLQGIPT